MEHSGGQNTGAKMKTFSLSNYRVNTKISNKKPAMLKKIIPIVISPEI